MCRALLYLGQPILSRELLYDPDNALIKQTYAPKFTGNKLSLAGFGIAAWNKKMHSPKLPLIYRTLHLPFYDINLFDLSEKLKSECFLAHVRGTDYTSNEIITQQNAHPFMYPNTHIAMAHNGQLAQLPAMKPYLYKKIYSDISEKIQGTTDTEWIYALFLSQFENPYERHSPSECVEAILKTLQEIAVIRHKLKINLYSPVNLFVTNGSFLIATRFAFDFGHFSDTYHDEDMSYHSLWYTYGHKYTRSHGKYQMNYGPNRSIIIASEPLTNDTSTWVEIPEYSIISAELHHQKMDIKVEDIGI